MKYGGSVLRENVCFDQRLSTGVVLMTVYLTENLSQFSHFCKASGRFDLSSRGTMRMIGLHVPSHAFALQIENPRKELG